VSSSAHLALVPWVTGWAAPSVAFDILVQLGTLAAVCVYLKQELKSIVLGTWQGLRAGKPLNNPQAVLGWKIVLATVPAVIFGLVFKDAAEAQWGNKQALLVELIINGALLIAAELWAKRSPGNRPITWLGAMLIGCGQAIAILPAISRSGATLAVAIAMGVRRKDAGAFSFLMSIPVMLGAGVLGAKDLLDNPTTLQQEAMPLAVATLVAAVVGFVVIRWFLDFVRTHTLVWFGLYCVVVGGAGLLWWR
jgi:undecaprenyl-diphosphatase